MDEEQKREIAVFRFGVIHDLVGGIRLQRGDQQRLLREKCERRWVVPHSSRTRLTRSTILRWVQRYKESNGKLESLYPIERSDQGVSRRLDEETALLLIRLRKELPKVPVRDLIETMHKRGLVLPGTKLSLSTVYRLLHRHHLMDALAPILKTGASLRQSFPTICGRAIPCMGRKWRWVGA